MDSARPFTSRPILAPPVPAIQKISNGELADGDGNAIESISGFRRTLRVAVRNLTPS